MAETDHITAAFEEDSWLRQLVPERALAFEDDGRLSETLAPNAEGMPAVAVLTKNRKCREYLHQNGIPELIYSGQIAIIPAHSELGREVASLAPRDDDTELEYPIFASYVGGEPDFDGDWMYY